ncbi:MAG: DUF1385 domain-containing protein [Armatimonadetes bacterium]|jgi:CBS domain-containing protein|nr:DUF1385 domain-containing protein [Armatimonadota bacterium]
MEGLRIGDVARPLAPLTPDDTLARAVELLRAVPFDRVPIVHEGRLVGVVTEQTAAKAMRAVVMHDVSPDGLRLLPLDERIITPVDPLQAEDPLARLATAFTEEVRSLPVVDQEGRYIGMVDAADVASTLLHANRPPSIGGMATPLGVYLTTGVVSAGARGGLGLILTGASIALVIVLARLLTEGMFHLAEQRSGFPIRAALGSPPMGWWHANAFDIWPHLRWLVGMVVFALLFRLSPLTGYHAAEHQVVHAVEQDRPLTPEHVAQMPRAHPRCGSRFFAVAVILGLFLVVLPISTAAGDAPFSLAGLVAVVAVIRWWRPLGTHIQNYVTTKPASHKQLRSAIGAAEELLERYRHAPQRRVTLAERLWAMGIIHVGVGMYATLLTLDYLVGRYLPFLTYFR